MSDLPPDGRFAETIQAHQRCPRQSLCTVLVFLQPIAIFSTAQSNTLPSAETLTGVQRQP